MPASFTHYSFGRDVFKYLQSSDDTNNSNTNNKEIIRIIEQNRALFDVGLNGPDILFYYKPLKRNAINSIGFDMHNKPASTFIKPVTQELISLNNQEKEIAYLLGFICHFTLDSECHPYIEDRIKSTGICHTEIETDFEKSVMKRRGVDYQTYNSSNHIKRSDDLINTISMVYNIEPAYIKTALKSMHFNSQLLLSGGFIKNNIVEIILKASNNYDDMKGLLMWRECDKSCSESTTHLNKMMKNAIPIAVELMDNWFSYFNKETNLCSRFDRTFD